MGRIEMRLVSRVVFSKYASCLKGLLSKFKNVIL